MYFTGIFIAFITFITIGLWHPIVIKTEYYWGTRPWTVYLLIGITCCAAALFIPNIYLSSFLGVFGASALWGIGELFSQQKRVAKGWFPMNPKRKHEYADVDIHAPIHSIPHRKQKIHQDKSKQNNIETHM